MTTYVWQWGRIRAALDLSCLPADQLLFTPHRQWYLLQQPSRLTQLHALNYRCRSENHLLSRWLNMYVCLPILKQTQSVLGRDHTPLPELGREKWCKTSQVSATKLSSEGLCSKPCSVPCESTQDAFRFSLLLAPLYPINSAFCILHPIHLLPSMPSPVTPQLRLIVPR